jgi:plasmid maintenance system antidote protein VapI
MSILETFYILFKSDASEVKKGAVDAKKSTEDLNSSLKNVNESSNAVGEAFLNMGRSLAGIATGLLTVRSILGNIKEAYAYTLQINQLSNALNVNGGDLDAWGAAVARNGGSLEGFANSIGALAKHLNITNQSAVELLPRLATVFQKIGPDKALRFGSSIGLDTQMIQLLLKGRKSLEETIEKERQLGAVTKENQAIAQQFHAAWFDVSRSFQSIWIQVASRVLPIIAEIADKFTEFAKYLKQHSDLVTAALGLLATAAGIAAVAFIVLNLPIVLLLATLAALTAAFAIVYEDVAQFLRGNKSLIGYLLEKWPVVGDVITGVFDGIRKSIELVLHAYNKIKGFITGNNPDNDISFNSELVKKNINEMAENPIGYQSPSIFGSGLNDNSNRSASIQTGPITINTQATDGEGVGNALSRGLRDQLRQATGTFDDGVVA